MAQTELWAVHQACHHLAAVAVASQALRCVCNLLFGDEGAWMALDVPHAGTGAASSEDAAAILALQGVTLPLHGNTEYYEPQNSLLHRCHHRQSFQLLCLWPGSVVFQVSLQSSLHEHAVLCRIEVWAVLLVECAIVCGCSLPVPFS